MRIKSLRDDDFVGHLGELRKRLTSVLVAFSIFLLMGILLSGKALDFILADMVPHSVRVVALTPFEYLFAVLRVSVFIALAMVFPFLLYHVMMFISPGLRPREKELVFRYLPMMIVLFLMGLVFGYSIFARIALYFLGGYSYVDNLWSISAVLWFIFSSSLLLGLLFETPVIIMVLARMGIMTPEQVRKKRRHAYVMILILSAVLTPTVDPVTMLVLAFPLMLLFEMSLASVKFIY